MRIYRDYKIIAEKDIQTFHTKLDFWSREGYMLYQPVWVQVVGNDYEWIAVMEIARAEEE